MLRMILDIILSKFVFYRIKLNNYNQGDFMSYCMYLRKSRADEQADISNRFDTLQRHEDILFELSRKLGLKIEKVFREIVSGDSIEARPVMQELLFQVEKKLWDGVFVIEVERLARGDTVDQGVVARTFKYSKTKIITPIKIYDPCDEFDEEYFEFGLFMSRREYKVINRRLQRGRLSSVREGKYTGSIAPYGYRKIKLKGEKGFTLKIDEDKAAVVKLIFNLFLNGTETLEKYEPLGISKISRYLNSNNIPSPSGKKWSPSSVYGILTNPVYCGQIRWNYRPALKSVTMGKMKTERPRNSPEKYLLVSGIHEKIIDKDVFIKVQEKISTCHRPPVNRSKTIKNPLAGIIICGKCGAKMVRKPANTGDYLVCPKNCGNVSCLLGLAEEKILSAVDFLTKGYEVRLNKSPKNTPVKEESLRCFSILNLENNLRKSQKQLEMVYSLFEQGIYSKEVFDMRKNKLTTEISKIKKLLSVTQNPPQEDEEIIFEPVKITEIYQKTTDPKIKNDILKELIFKVEYKKEKSARWHCSPDAFEITVYPKLPKR